jgi:hypothetical protein
MKGIKHRLNIDKLTLCYIAPKSIVDELENTKVWVCDGFKIDRVEEFETNNETYLKISISEPNEEEYKEYALIKIGNKFEKEEDDKRYVWIMIDNRIFYGYNRYSNDLNYIFYIADYLKLEFNNITDIHIALNSNINWFCKVKKAIRNLSLIPIILNKKYPNEKEIIDKVLYLHTADRKRYRTDTMIIKNAEKDMEIDLYDKTNEIIDSNKKYIKDDFGGNTNIFRNEVRLKKTALKDYLDYKGINWEDFYMRLTDFEFLFDVYIYFQNKIIRFTNKKRELISILEL